jgi:polysaccharide deacetylase family protein (PEP-CTERM system associated)
MLHALTVDVEDYWFEFHRDWLHKPIENTDAVVRNMHWFLELFAEFDTKATFFVLGCVAKSFPKLIQEIAEQGHEIASHGFSHMEVFRLSREAFRAEAADSKKLLEDVASVQVRGFRAPAFSIMRETAWALDILAEERYDYDSSVVPFKGRRYGWPGFSKGICKIDLPKGSQITEVPLPTFQFMSMRFPVAGGGYFRLFPYAFTSFAIKSFQKRVGPVVSYFHPYEIDLRNILSDLEEVPAYTRYKALAYHKTQVAGRRTVEKKLRKLLKEFTFTTMEKIILLHEGSLIAESPG